MTLDFSISLDGVADVVDPQQLADTVEKIIESYTGLSCHTTILDSDDANNPIMMNNQFKLVGRR